jgi:hypothetical protein
VNERARALARKLTEVVVLDRVGYWAGGDGEKCVKVLPLSGVARNVRAARGRELCGSLNVLVAGLRGRCPCISAISYARTPERRT